MRQAGEVTYAEAHKERKNEAIVEFGNHDDLRTALDKLDNTELNGRRIKLSLLLKRSTKRRSRTRSRSHEDDDDGGRKR